MAGQYSKWSRARRAREAAQRGASYAPSTPQSGPRANPYNTSAGMYRPAPMRSPASMGQLVTYAERQALSPSGGRNPYNNSSAYNYGREFGEMRKRAEASKNWGRNAVGRGKGLARFLRRFSGPMNYADNFRIVRMLVNNLIIGPIYDKNVYGVTIFCGGGATYASGVHLFNVCGESVNSKSGRNVSLTATVVGFWKQKQDYINPSFFYADPHMKITRGSTAPAFPCSVGLTPTPVVQAIPSGMAGHNPIPTFGQPHGWAPGLNEPVTNFDNPNETEVFNGPGPWEWDYTEAGDGTRSLPGTQTVTPPPVGGGTWTDYVPAPRPPRRGTKEQKFAGSKIMLRLLRLSLAMTEALDAEKAIYDALPDETKKGCAKLARQRQQRNIREGKYWGTTSRAMMPHEMALCLYHNLDQLKLDHVMYNLVKNQIEDLWAGFQYGAVDNVMRRTRQHGGPLSTKSPYRHQPLDLPDFDDPFWDEVEEWISARERK